AWVFIVFAIAADGLTRTTPSVTRTTVAGCRPLAALIIVSASIRKMVPRTPATALGLHLVLRAAHQLLDVGPEAAGLERAEEALAVLALELGVVDQQLGLVGEGDLA